MKYTAFAPAARIALRYGAGLLLGSTIGDKLAADPDVVIAAAVAIGVAVEGIYALAKKKGWST